MWRYSARDSILVALAALHAVALLVWPSAPLIALGVWWNSNTVAHNLIHRPFFRSTLLNRAFSAGLSLLLGIPQALWRDRHLAHHAGVVWRLRISRRLVLETALVAGLWIALASLAPRFFLLAYLPGYLAGLGLCALQGHWEHAAGRPVSHYGRVYNFLCFNDGLHAEHHADPSTHWTHLRVEDGAASSPWPPLLRWLDCHPLEALECLVLRSPVLQRFVLARHREALRKLLPHVECVTIVGGGLFPRTALVLRELLPGARLTLVDGSARNLEIARSFLGDAVDYRNEWVGHALPPGPTDLTVIPLCFTGNREEIYRHPPSAAVLVHDWIWRRRGTSAIVSILLLKRINLVRSCGADWPQASWVPSGNRHAPRLPKAARNDILPHGAAEVRR